MLVKNLKFKDWNCYLKIGIYTQSINKNIALALIDCEDDEIVTVMTVNPNTIFPKTHACIRNYLENEGLLDFAIANKIVIEDSTARSILLPNGVMVDCFKVADNIYNEYLELLKKYESEEI